jgi:hypothetical protein
VGRNGHLAGPLHRAKRALCEVGGPEYHRALLQAFAEAEAALVVKPLAERDLSVDQAEGLLLDSVFSADPFGPL